MNSGFLKVKSLQKFDADAATYEQTSDGKFCSRVYPSILQQLNSIPHSALLDVGCGTGIILSRVNGSDTLCGIDLSKQMIEQAKNRLGDKADLRVGDAELLPWADAAFNTVCCSFSFHHYPHPQVVLREMNRVLKKGGLLLLADPWMPSPLRQISNLVMPYSTSGDIHIYSIREITNILSKEGFNLQSFQHPTNDTFLLLAEKL